MIDRLLAISIVIVLISGCESMPCDSDLVVRATVNHDKPPRACRTDGCTLVPDLPDTAACCHQHDVVYWRGGSRSERLQADTTFRSCINAASHPVFATIYYMGVRVAATPYLPVPWRWGFGWDYFRDYEAAGADPAPAQEGRP